MLLRLFASQCICIISTPAFAGTIDRGWRGDDYVRTSSLPTPVYWLIGIAAIIWIAYHFIRNPKSGIFLTGYMIACTGAAFAVGAVVAQLLGEGWGGLFFFISLLVFSHFFERPFTSKDEKIEWFRKDYSVYDGLSSDSFENNRKPSFFEFAKARKDCHFPGWEQFAKEEELMRQADVKK